VRDASCSYGAINSELLKLLWGAGEGPGRHSEYSASLRARRSCILALVRAIDFLFSIYFRTKIKVQPSSFTMGTGAYSHGLSGWGGPGSSDGIATGYGLDGPGIEKKIQVGVRFFAHVQTGPGAHPVSCTMGTGSFPEVKRPGRGADHPPPSSVEVENE
jgi:hypothetical protein